MEESVKELDRWLKSKQQTDPELHTLTLCKYINGHGDLTMETSSLYPITIQDGCITIQQAGVVEQFYGRMYICNVGGV